MNIPVSDADFFERKAARLEKDIANLNEELNIARARLRSAQDFQIKYQLLLRQSQQDNLRIRKIQQAQRAQIAQLIDQQIEKTNQQWMQRLNQLEQDILAQQREEKNRLISQVQELQRKNKEMVEKSEQMDVLLFKNKKIAKDLEALEQIIQENRINNERQRQEDLRLCKQSLTKKFEQKVDSDKEEYELAINRLKQKYERLQVQLMKAEMNTKQQQHNKIPSAPSLLIQSKVKQELEKMAKLLGEKDQIISLLQTTKIQQEQRHQKQLKQLKGYHNDLEQQIFSMQTNHEVQILNFKIRMDQARAQQLNQKQQQYEVVEKQHLKDVETYNEKILKQKAQLQHIRKIQQAQIVKLKDDKLRLLKKIEQLKQRLQQFQINQEAGQTQNMLHSLKHLDKKEDEISGYEEGVTFLERQLRKAVIKLEKKNAEVKQLVSKMSNLNEQFERQLQQSREKYRGEVKQKEERVEQLQEDIKQLNQLLRKKQKQNRDQQTEFTKKMNQINAENRSLINMNNDLQRDYNRILESKKVIEKSFREERERSMTSKSQIAIAKKNKWLQLERQKNQIEIIYKEKEEQMKTNYQMIITEIRTENDKLKRQKDLLQHQLITIKKKIKNNQPSNDEKENAYSQFHKKLATVNLEIALTQNLYNSLMKAKSRVKKSDPEKEIETEIERKNQNPIQRGQRLQENQGKERERQSGSSKVAQFQVNLNKVEEKGYKSFERSIRQIEKISQNSSRQVKDSRDLKQFNKSENENPLYFDSDDDGGMSPTFNMFNSFNPKR